jgi:hypothetical protein
MFRVIRAFLFDGVSWLLLAALFILTFASVTHLFNRYDELDIYARNLAEIKNDIVWLQQQKIEKQDWIQRLHEDPTSWEIVAREKMNYLGKDQVLIRFHAADIPDLISVK